MFMDRNTKRTGNKRKLDKLDFIKIKNIFVHQRILSRKQKDNLLNWRKYLQIIYVVRD